MVTFSEYTQAEVLSALRAPDRELSFRFDILDRTNAFKKTSDRISDCSVEHKALADIKRSIKFSMEDDAGIDYLNDRIKPFVRVRMPDEPSYMDELRTIGPRHVWRFDETSGTTAEELIEGADGTYVGTVLLDRPGALPGEDGRGVRLDSDGHVSFTLPSTLRPERTVVIWVKPDWAGTDNVLHGLWQNHDTATASPANSVSIFKSAANDLTLQVVNQAGTVTNLSYAITGYKFAARAWHCIVASWSGTSGKLWLDGTLVASNAGFAMPQDEASTFRLGYAQGAYAAHVVMDEHAIMDHVVTDAEVTTLWQSGRRLGTYGRSGYAEFPQGVFLMSTPGRKTDEAGRVVREVEGYDQTKVLLDDKVDSRHVAASGTKFTDEVINQLTAAGITDYRVQPNDATLPKDLEWPPGTERLRIINALLTAINYQALWFDEHGVAVAEPYIQPDRRAVTHTYHDDGDSVIFHGTEEVIDLFDIPNKWVIMVSEPDLPPMLATYTNQSILSPTSTYSRGRTIVDFRERDYQDAPTQATLDARVERIAFEASQVYSYVEMETALMPIHSHFDILDVRVTDLGVDDVYTEMGWSFQLRQGARMQHSIRRIVKV